MKTDPNEEIFGYYTIDASDINSITEINLYPYNLAKFWGQCGITANYGASLISSLFLSNNVLFNSLSTILNELLENALKYSGKETLGIFIKFFICGQKTIIFQIENYLEKEQYERFKTYVKELTECNDVSKRYLNHLESLVPDAGGSGIGLLSILNIYNIKLGFKFTNQANNSFMVSVQTVIDPGGLAR